MNNENKSTVKACRPQLVKLNKALKMAEKWVSAMSTAADNESTEVELEGRPLRLGLGATVPRQPNVGPVTDAVERKLRANLGIDKRKADESIEKAKDGNDVEWGDEDENENLDSRASLFLKKKMVPLDPYLQAKKKKKK